MLKRPPKPISIFLLLAFIFNTFTPYSFASSQEDNSEEVFYQQQESSSADKQEPVNNSIPHLFRHSDAIIRLRKTGNPKALQYHLGHNTAGNDIAVFIYVDAGGCT